jgi:hypothetical protein
MSEHSDCLAHDEEANTEPVAPRMIQPSEGVEDFRHFLIGDTAARIEHVDAHVLTNMTAAHENSAAGFGVFDGVASQIAKDGTEK